MQAKHGCLYSATTLSQIDRPMLYQLLGFRDSEFTAGLGWHDKIREGFPQLAVWSLSRALSVPLEETAALVGLPRKGLEWAQRKQLLSPDASANLFRIAQAYHRLFALLKDKAIVSNWLRTPRRELGALTPIVMLLSQPGSELVLDAIGKIKPVKTVEMSVERAAPEKAEDAEEDEEHEREDGESSPEDGEGRGDTDD